MKYNHITIVIAARNVANYVERSLTSALQQNYPSFNILYIDACSDDGSYDIVKSYEDINRNLKVIRNETRKYQVENYRLAVDLAPDKSIIVTLDGDDWFPHSEVLQRVNKEYVETDCWMTYGTYEEHPYRDVRYHYREYPLTVRALKQFRTHTWLGSHLRTFKRELFLKIKPEDFIDPGTGEHFALSGDRVFQYPMLEMCGVDKSQYIPEILYVYNVENPYNESKYLQEEIERVDEIVKHMTKYPTLAKLYEDE